MSRQRLRIFDDLELPTPPIGELDYRQLVAQHPGRLMAWDHNDEYQRALLVIPRLPTRSWGSSVLGGGKLIVVGSETRFNDETSFWWCREPRLEDWAVPDPAYRLLAMPVPPEVQARIPSEWFGGR